MANSQVSISEGDGDKIVASYSISESAATKEIQRVALNDSAGAEVVSNPNGSATSANSSPVVIASDQAAVATKPLTANLLRGIISTAMTGTTSTAVSGMGAPGSATYNYITQITVSNTHATVGTNIELQDGSGGTTFYIIPAAAVYGGAAISFPTPLKQPTANTALYAKNTTTGASTYLSAVGFTGA